MTRRWRFGVWAAIGLCGVAACVPACVPAPEGQAPESGPATAPPPLLRGAIERAERAGAVRVAFRESPAGALRVRRVAARAESCVYVPLCNQSGYWGTVCGLHPGCSLDDAAWAECQLDARHRCGVITYPIYLGYRAPPLTNLADAMDAMDAISGR